MQIWLYTVYVFTAILNLQEIHMYIQSYSSIGSNICHPLQNENQYIVVCLLMNSSNMSQNGYWQYFLLSHSMGRNIPNLWNTCSINNMIMQFVLGFGYLLAVDVRIFSAPRYLTLVFVQYPIAQISSTCTTERIQLVTSSTLQATFTSTCFIIQMQGIFTSTWTCLAQTLTLIVIPYF